MVLFLDGEMRSLRSVVGSVCSVGVFVGFEVWFFWVSWDFGVVVFMVVRVLF